MTKVLRQVMDKNNCVVDLPSFGYILRSIGDKKFISLQKKVNDYMIQYNVKRNRQGTQQTKTLSVPNCKLELTPIVDEMVDTYIKHYDYGKGQNPADSVPELHIQSKNEWIINEKNNSTFTYIAWISIPYNMYDEQEHSQDINKTLNYNVGQLQLTYESFDGLKNQPIKVDKDDEGGIVLFPSKFNYSVYPFYNTDDNRLFITGHRKIYA